MNDQTIPADKVREIIARHRDGASHRGGMILNDLKALLPLPTLADMTEEERAACKWMQADTKLWARVVIVLHNAGGGRAVTINRRGHVAYEDHADVTPRPDLPRLEWPGDTPTGSDHLAVGTVIESADDPRIAALPPGSILLDREGEATTKLRWAWTGLGYSPVPWQGSEFGPWTVLHIPKEADQ